jgi:hypothetical protein
VSALGLRPNSFITPAAEKARRNGEMIAVPYFVNIGLFCYRKDLLDAAGFDAPPETWRDVADFADKISRTHSRECPIKFDFDRRAQESWAVMMLELLFAAQSDPNLLPTMEKFRQGKSIILGRDVRLADSRDRSFVNLLYIFRRLIDQKVVRETPRCSGDAVFSRQWFSTLGEVLQENPDLKSRIGFAGLPRFCTGNVGTSGCFAGEWYLAMPADSGSPEVGQRIIEELATSEKDRERFYCSVGLPAHVASYRQVSRGTSTEIDGKLGTMRSLYRRSLTRLCISHYRQVSGELARRFREVLLYPLQTDERAEKRWLWESLRNLEAALLAISGSDLPQGRSRPIR